MWTRTARTQTARQEFNPKSWSAYQFDSARGFSLHPRKWRSGSRPNEHRSGDAGRGCELPDGSSLRRIPPDLHPALERDLRDLAARYSIVGSADSAAFRVRQPRGFMGATGLEKRGTILPVVILCALPVVILCATSYPALNPEAGSLPQTAAHPRPARQHVPLGRGHPAARISVEVLMHCKGRDAVLDFAAHRASPGTEGDWC